MYRRALLRAAGTGAGVLALSGVGQSVAADGVSTTGSSGYREVSTWSPLEVEGWEAVPPTLRTLHDIYVYGDYAYCCYWDAGTWILDVSDPQNPSFVARVGDYELDELTEIADDRDALISEYTEAPGNDHYAVVDEDETVLAVGAEGWDDPDTDVRGVGGIDLFDITDIENPQERATIEPPEATDESRQGTWVTSHNFDVHGDRLYTSWYQGGVKIHDISDPADPEELTWWRQPDEAAFWTAKLAKPGEFFVATSYGGEEAGLYTFPDRAGQQPDPPSLTDDPVDVDGGDYEPLGFVSVGGAAEAVVGDDGETVYVAASDGFAIVDVSDPEAPEVVAERRELASDQENGPLQSILDVKVEGDNLVVPGPAQRGQLRGFLVYDVSDPANPEQRGQFFETAHTNHNAFVQDDYVYLTGNGVQGNPMVVVDISDPSEATTTTTTETTADTTTTETTATGTTETTTTETTETTTTETTTDPEGTPGFGIGAAIGGLGLGALGIRRYLQDDDE